MVSFDNPNSDPEVPQFDPWMDHYHEPQQQQQQQQQQHALDMYHLPPFQDQQQHPLHIRPQERRSKFEKDQLYFHPGPTAEENEHRSPETLEQKIKMQLLEHPSVLTEMQLVTQKRIRLQQRPSSNCSNGSFLGQVGTTAPSLFVILPKVSTTDKTAVESQQQQHNHSQHQQQQEIPQEEFRLHFLCDYSHENNQHWQESTLVTEDGMDVERRHDHVDESRAAGHFVPSTPASPPPSVSTRSSSPVSTITTSPKVSTAACPSLSLHVCEPEQGYALRDLEDFCQVHKMCLLSLLRALQSSPSLEQEGVQYEPQQHDEQQTQDRKEEALKENVDMDITEDNNTVPTAQSQLLVSPPLPSPFSDSTSSLASLTYSSSGLMQKRIEIAIHYLLRYFSMADLEGILQTPSDTDMEDYDDTSLPGLRVEDFANPDMDRIQKTATSDGRILGPLMQRNSRTIASPISRNDAKDQRNSTAVPKSTTPSSGSSRGVVQWLCPLHTLVYCKAEDREKLKAVIVKNEGSYLEQERSAEIYLRTSESAAEFYGLLREYRCVVKLKIHLGWQNLVEEDLWELGDVVSEANIGDLTLDCCCDAEEVEESMVEEERHEWLPNSRQETQPQDQQSQHRQHQTPLSFKPLLGMMFSPSLVSFTLENFTGSLPTLNASNFKVSLDEFSFQAYRESVDLILPTSNNLRNLILNRCGPTTKATRLLELIRHCPYLTEIQLECSRIDDTLAKISEATNQLDKITFIKLSESPWECAEMTFGKGGPPGEVPELISQQHQPQQTYVHSIARKTRRPLHVGMVCAGVLEQLTTCCFLDLWEQHLVPLGTLIGQNPRLQHLELMCETQSLGQLWRFLTSQYHHHQLALHQQQQFGKLNMIPVAMPELQNTDSIIISTLAAAPPASSASASFFRLRLNDQTCSLLTVSPTQNALILHSYTPQHRLLLQSLEDITTSLCFGSRFDSADQLVLLRSHFEQDGGSRFKSLTWVLSQKTQDDSYFLEQLRALVTVRNEITKFTIRVFSPLFEIRSLIRAWNYVVDTAWLNEEEHGRWMQACLEHEDNDNNTSRPEFVRDESASHHTSEMNVAGRSFGTSGSSSNVGSTAAAAAAAAAAANAASAARQAPGHGMIQSYTLPLDEERELTLSSSHIIPSSMPSSSIASTHTALTYSLSLSKV